MGNWRVVIALAVGVAVLADAMPVCAQDAASTDTPEPTQAQIWVRTARIQKALDAEQLHARLWWGGWLTAFSSISVGQGIATWFNRDDRSKRAANLLRMSGALLGVIGLVYGIHPARHAGDELRDLPASTPAEHRAKLDRAEALLHEAAETERFNSSWVPHIGGVVVNSAIALPLWLEYDERRGAIINVIAGMLVTELQILTTPKRLIAVEEACEARFSCRMYEEPPRIRLFAVPMRGGLALTGVF